MLHTNKPIFVQRQALVSRETIGATPREIYMKLLNTPPIKPFRAENAPAFVPSLFVSNKLYESVTDRSFGATADNKFEKGDMAISTTLILDEKMIEKYKDTMLKDLLKRGEDRVIDSGDHFPLGGLNLNGLKPEDVSELEDHLIISMGNREGTGPLSISFMGKRAADLIQTHLKDEIANKSVEPGVRADLLAVWKYLKETGRAGESREGTVALVLPFEHKG